MNNIRSRREFLAFAAASPLLAQEVGGKIDGFDVKDPKDVLSSKDMEILASQRIAIPHFGYLQTGIDDNLTLKANDAAPKKIVIRPRRLLGAATADTKVTVFGETFPSPIFLCPVASHKQYNKEGESGVARAAKKKNSLMILSSDTTTPIEDVVQNYGRPVWYQMYSPNKFEDVEKMTRRVEAAGTKIMAITVDNMGGRNTESQVRMARTETRSCTDAACHGSGWKPPAPVMRLGTAGNWTFDWSWVERIQKITNMTLMIKGVVRREDAAVCVARGIKGIIVSNHGGRNTEEARGSLECLQEVLDGAAGRIPVFVDGGFRRGSDVFKALALGAAMVGIGRPYCWGLGAFGQAGVERAIDIMNGELAMTMRQCGTKSIGEINPSFLKLGPDWLGDKLSS